MLDQAAEDLCGFLPNLRVIKCLLELLDALPVTAFGWRAEDTGRFFQSQLLDPKRTLGTSTQISDYSPDSMALSSWKRSAPLLLSEITKRTRPCFAVSA